MIKLLGAYQHHNDPRLSPLMTDDLHLVLIWFLAIRHGRISLEYLRLKNLFYSYQLLIELHFWLFFNGRKGNPSGKCYFDWFKRTRSLLEATYLFMVKCTNSSLWVALKVSLVFRTQLCISTTSTLTVFRLSCNSSVSALCSDYKWRRQNNSQASNSELSVNITNLRIFLSDVSLHELQNLLDYMYFGLVMLPFGNLEIFPNI